MGSVWFWLTFGILPFVLLTIFIYSDDDFMGVVTLALALVGVTLLSDFNLFTWIYTNPWLVVHYSLYYVAIAVVFSMFKWFLKMLDSKADYLRMEQTYRDYYAKSNNNVGQTYSQYIAKAWDQPPSILKHKALVTSWMAWWPAVLVATIFGDLLQKLWNWLYVMFLGIYTAIGKMVYGNVIKDR